MLDAGAERHAVQQERWRDESRPGESDSERDTGRRSDAPETDIDEKR